MAILGGILEYTVANDEARLTTVQALMGCSHKDCREKPIFYLGYSILSVACEETIDSLRYYLVNRTAEQSARSFRQPLVGNACAGNFRCNLVRLAWGTKRDTSPP